jgi:cell division septum initiation protein DivIVA
MMKADALEEEFNRVRMTAGATDASDGVEAGASATLQEQQHDPKALRFRPPNPKQVIHRFEVMQEEVGDADRQIADLSRRITHLSRAKTELGKALQPTAMDPVEETTFSREDRAMLENQSSLCRRELESQRLELERLKRLKVFLGQALGSIFARLQHISPDAPVGVRKPLPTVSNWARTVYSKLQETVERLLFVREEIDRSQAKPSRSGHNGLLVDPSVDDSEHFSKSKHFEATIESVVTTNEMGIRIPTMSNTASRRELVPKDFRSATQQFSSAHSRAQKDSRSHSSSGGSTDEVPALGMLSKQRPKSSRLGTARASAAAAREAQDGKRKAPKATEVTRFLAAAVSQTGQAVHEDILASLNDEPDEAPDRSRIKSNSHHEMQSYASLASMPTGK